MNWFRVGFGQDGHTVQSAAWLGGRVAGIALCMLGSGSVE